MAGCSSSTIPAPDRVQIVIVDGDQTFRLGAEIGSTVQAALTKAGVVLSKLDRVEPSSFTRITDPLQIAVIRVSERFDFEEIVIPYDQQVVRNETLAEGEQLLIQPGSNGIKELTYRSLMENGVEVSRSLFKSVIKSPPQAEIVMVGSLPPSSPIQIPGKIAYISAGNIWLMEQNSGNRSLRLKSGDLDGRIFSLSNDQQWLLFSRKSDGTSQKTINSLWILNLSNPDNSPISLGIENVIHYAGWNPQIPQSIYYSTVEPRTAAPGWQANNDLWVAELAIDGEVINNQRIVETNGGGVYGWWGTEFSWSPDGNLLAYSRPDSIGLVSIDDGEFVPILDILPLQTRADWAWIPDIEWSADSQLLYAVTHEELPGSTNLETSPIFNLTSVAVSTGQAIQLVTQSGMFSQPVLSPLLDSEPQRLAYLQAVFPEQSDTSRYKLLITDQDGSNTEVIFPPSGVMGLEPQKIVWSPGGEEGQPTTIGFLNQGNIWLIDPRTAVTRQVTGDGMVSRIDWK